MVKPTQPLNDDNCHPVDAGVLFRPFAYQCADQTLQFAGAAPFDGKLARSNDKADVISFLAGQGIVVCNQANFMVAGAPLTITVRRATKCPWYADEEITFRVEIDYSEAISPTVRTDAATKNDPAVWTALTTYDQNEASNNLGDPYSYGSSGQGEVQLTITFNPSTDPCDDSSTLTFTATLNSLGLGTYEDMDSIPQAKTQSLVKSCIDWVDAIGLNPNFGWVGVKFTPAHGAIGLVQALVMTVFRV